LLSDVGLAATLGRSSATGVAGAKVNGGSSIGDCTGTAVGASVGAGMTVTTGDGAAVRRRRVGDGEAVGDGCGAAEVATGAGGVAVGSGRSGVGDGEGDDFLVGAGDGVSACAAPRRSSGVSSAPAADTTSTARREATSWMVGR
jgi:hypothetical protein